MYSTYIMILHSGLYRITIPSWITIVQTSRWLPAAGLGGLPTSTPTIWNLVTGFITALEI